MKKSKARRKQSQLEHGGSFAKGKRKAQRCLCTKRSTHLVLKSNKAKEIFDVFMFLDHTDRIKEIIEHHANKFGVKVYAMSVQEDHLHLSIYFKQRENYVKFIRAITGHIVKTLSKILKINLKGIFDIIPYTKIISWGKEFKNVLNYIAINQLEALGFKNVRGGWYLDEKQKEKNNSSQLHFDTC